ncbi:helix-turn-helix domain-containing protein [soil metagenome]
MQSPSGGIQSAFLEHIKKNLPKNVSFADELAEILAISRDSAYRRIRGETVLSLDEVQALTNHFKISLDAFLSPASDQVTFQLKAINQKDFSFEKWLISILEYLDLFNSFKETQKEIVFDSKDLPVFYYFQFPRLAAFKIYFWKNSFSMETKVTSGKYDSSQVGKNLIALGEKIWERYSQIPSTEIIRYEMLIVTLRQIEYLYESGMFMDKQEAINLCDDCSLLATHLQHQAKLGSKVTYGSNDPGAKVLMYLNDVLIGGNTILFRIGEKRIVFVTPNNFDILRTDHLPFCQLTEEHTSNLINKSVLISGTAEKERNRFFNRIEERIREIKTRIT